MSAPPRETITLDDYRTRYAWYRADPDLAELHRAVQQRCAGERDVSVRHLTEGLADERAVLVDQLAE